MKAADLGIPMYVDAEDWHYTRALTNEEKARTSLDLTAKDVGP
jgi:hypothetical protein